VLRVEERGELGLGDRPPAGVRERQPVIDFAIDRPDLSSVPRRAWGRAYTAQSPRRLTASWTTAIPAATRTCAGSANTPSIEASATKSAG
jgi:hypothetical protein